MCWIAFWWCESRVAKNFNCNFISPHNNKRFLRSLYKAIRIQPLGSSVLKSEYKKKTRVVYYTYKSDKCNRYHTSEQVIKKKRSVKRNWKRFNYINNNQKLLTNSTKRKMMEHQNQQDLVPTGAPAEVPNDPG